LAVAHVELDLKGTRDAVPLFVCVLSKKVNEFSAQHVSHIGELVIVGLRQFDAIEVRHDSGARHPDRSVEVHLSNKFSPDLDRSNLTFEHAAENALDAALKSSFEIRDTHAPTLPVASPTFRRWARDGLI
jgi:hypothetical protein